MILTRQDIEQLTGTRRVDAQRAELEHLRIPYRVRRNGTLVVLLADVQGVPQKVAAPEPQLCE